MPNTPENNDPGAAHASTPQQPATTGTCPAHGGSLTSALSSPVAEDSKMSMGCPMRRHGFYPQDVVPPRSKYFDSGRFGRIFGELPPFAADTPQVRDGLLAIGAAGGIMDPKDKLTDPKLLITDANLQIDNPNNPRMPAGMTFLGQFLDHDMTFDPTSSLERQSDPEHIANFRTPTFGLDHLYGAGPAGSPHLYDQPPHGSGVKFLIEEIPDSGTPLRTDVPRNSQLVALIGDPRNDENLIISQLHLGFLRFHNAVVDYVQSQPGMAGSGADEIFAESQRIVRWHYQWIIVHEFLRLTCTQPVVDDVLTNGRKFYHWRNEPFIPVEFSVAAYRFGHSQVRPSYRANFSAGTGNTELFQFIFQAVANHSSPEKDDLSGSFRAPWRFIDWQTFFDFKDGKVRNNKKIDTKLSTPLFTLPGTVVQNPNPKTNPQSLAQRNLLRHLTFSLPSGQRVARAMKAKVPAIVELQEGDLIDLKPHGLHNRTPLWFYILKEAEVLAAGEHLGPVGGRIVAEVFIGLLQGDPYSYLSQDVDWTPFLPTIDPATTGSDFQMVDLLRFAGVA
jgi:hypothetical protein